MPNNVIDKAALARLLEVIGGDPDDFAELLEDFRSEAPAIQEKMQSAAAAEDLTALRICAHSLKSNARDFGATELAKICEVLERDCHSGQMDDPVGRVGKVFEELGRVQSALAEIASANE